MTLDLVKPSEKCMIIGYQFSGKSSYRQKLLALGLIKGTEVEVVSVAPLGDPFLIKVRGYDLSLRKDEVSVVKVKLI